MAEFSEALRAKGDDPDFSTPEKILDYARVHADSYLLVHAAVEALVSIMVTHEGAEKDPELIAAWDEISVIAAKAKILNGVRDSSVA